MEDAALKAKTDRELLLLTVQETGHISTHLEKLTKQVSDQNGRISSLERSLPENLSARLTIIEHWKVWATGMFTLIAFVAPFFIYEVRQAALKALEFIPDIIENGG